MKKLFNVGSEIPKKTTLIIEILGLLFFILIWYLITYPKENLSVQFYSSDPAGVSYVWNGPDDFKQEFKGDNILMKLKSGEYSFIVKDTTGNELAGTIQVPDTITETIVKEFSAKSEYDSLSLTLEIKSVKDGWVSRAIIPQPVNVLKSLKKLFTIDSVYVKQHKRESIRHNIKVLILSMEGVRTTGYSLILNVLGYIEAIVISILLGFLIGLVPFFRALLNRWVNAIRFIALTAVTGLFIAWFGIDSNMKVQFLAFGIFVYLLPVVVQRVDEVLKIYLQTAYTLGASKWQLIKTVYFPFVASKIIDDIRVLTAISWTYIIIAEMLNQTGGVGALIHLSGRQSRLDKVFALLIIIVLIGIIQDKFFVWLDKKIFQFKYQGESTH